ncbi:unnamed protein product, partial [Mesorhabditis spiculigera]
MLLLFLFAAAFHTVAAQMCTTAGNGPCINGACAVAGDTCATFNGNTVCCPAANILTTRRTTVATCVDKLNPSTGVSDCPKRAYLCQDSTYYAVMTDQCPRTCGRCSGSATTPRSTTCVDKLNPSTGVSDCPNRRAYCTNSAYLSLMRDQCPRTCGFCTAG